MEEVREYIRSKLASWGYELSALELEVLIAEANLTDDAQTTQFSITETLPPYQVGIWAKKVLINLIPELLLQPDVTEGGYSIKRNAAGITAYYNLLCGELGIPSQLTKGPTLTDKSNYW